MSQLYTFKTTITDFVRSFKLPLLTFGFYLIFREKSHDIIESVIVNPVMSSIKEPKRYLDFIFWGTCLLAIAILIYNIIEKVHISDTMVAWVLLISGIYCYERFYLTHYKFESHYSQGFKHWAYADILIVAGLLTIIYIITRLFKKSKENEKDNTKGFFTDFPTDKNAVVSDLYERNPQIASLKERIISTDCTNGAFGIGIIGKWGSGKTSFINKLHKLFEKESNVVQMWFNPWMVNSPDKLIEVFFSDLSNTLSRYDKNLKNTIADYSKELLKSINYNNLNIPNFFANSRSSSSLSDQSEEISKVIERLHRKVIIYIDDLDRLDKKESLEVLKLIRNTANFSNTFFIVAFDRNYLLDNIRESLAGNVENYLEKIFQLEYYLPIVTNNGIASLEIKKVLPNYLGVKQKEVFDTIFGPAPKDGYVNAYEVFPRLDTFLENLRDVKRFMNIFILDFHKLQTNVYLPDYLNICILRLKFPEVYYELYYNRFLYLEIPTNDRLFYTRSDEYKLKVTNESKKDQQQIVLIKELGANLIKYALTKDSLEKFKILIISIFDSSNDIHSKSRTLPFNHQTIIKSNNFSKYFDCFLKNRLDQNLFDLALESNDNTFFDFIQNTAKSNVHEQLKNYLEGESPLSRDQFERLIHGIFIYAELTPIRTSYKQYVLSVDAVINQLGGHYFQNNNVLEKFYKNQEDYKIFLNGLLNSIDTISPFNLKCRVFRSLGYNPHGLPEDQLVMSRNEFIKWCKQKLYYLLDKQGRLTDDSILTFQFIIDSHDFEILYAILKENYVDDISDIIATIKKNVLRNSLKLFFENSIIIQQKGRPCTKLHDSFKLIFPSKPELVKAIDESNLDNAFTTEFLNFYELAIILGENSWVDKFEFDILSIKVIDPSYYY